jgi:hypothetical protein
VCVHFAGVFQVGERPLYRALPEAARARQRGARPRLAAAKEREQKRSFAVGRGKHDHDAERILPSRSGDSGTPFRPAGSQNEAIGGGLDRGSNRLESPSKSPDFHAEPGAERFGDPPSSERALEERGSARRFGSRFG